MITRIRDLAPDTILHSGRIVTLDPDGTVAQALAIKGGRLVAVGADGPVRALAGPATRVADLGGKTLIPGLIDSHTHLPQLGLEQALPAFQRCETIADVVAVVEEAVRSAPPGKWIVCAGGCTRMPGQLREQRFPTRHDLDRVSPHNPVYLPGHATAVNSLGLRLAGIDRDTPDPEGGRIVRDPQTGEPTGVLLQTAGWIVKRIVPHPDVDEIARGITLACRAYNAVGVTSIGYHGAVWDELAAYARVREAGALTVRHYVHVLIDHTQDWAEIEKALDHLSFAALPGFGDEMSRLGGIKLFFDGGVGLGTALQRQPYVTADGTLGLGVQNMPTGLFARIAEGVARRKLRLAVHDSGGGAVDVVFGVMEDLSRRHPIAEQRFIPVHAQLPTADNMRVARELGFAPCVQTVFTYVNAAGYRRFIGPDLAHKANPLASWLERGVPVGLGSDTPINPYNPFVGIWHAMTRQDIVTGEVLGPEERISRDQALRGYTVNNARVSMEEHLKGTLEPGKLADYVVLDRDILTCAVDEIKEIRPLATVVGGQVVYGELR